MSVDDVVIVHSTDQPRGFWKLGQIKEAPVGLDGEIRGAVVQVAGRGTSGDIAAPSYPTPLPTGGVLTMSRLAATH